MSRVVDLSHEFGPGSPGSADFDGEHRFPALRPAADGFQLSYHTLPGAWGTHVDAPAHMVEGGRTVDQLSADELVLPMVVIDLSDEVTANPDTCLTVDHIGRWERRYGRISDRCFVAFRSDWSKRWPDQRAMLGNDHPGHDRSPGWTPAAVEFLIRRRNVTAIGHETIDTDPGRHTSRTFHGDTAKETARRQHPAEARVFEHDRYQVEMLTNLDNVPPVGATVVVGVGKARAATAFPARVIALLPPERDQELRHRSTVGCLDALGKRNAGSDEPAEGPHRSR
jgi:kynurenine formamidase